MPPLFGETSLLLAREPRHAGADCGFIGIRNDESGKRLIVVAARDGDCEDDKLDAAFTVQLSEGGAYLLDIVTLASHPMLRSRGNVFVRYQGLPGNVRRLVMSVDAVILTAQLLPSAATPSPSSTSILFVLRQSRFNKAMFVLVTLATVLMIIQQIK